MKMTPVMPLRALQVGLTALIVCVAGSSPAAAAIPIGGGHYLLDTPQSASHLFPGRWPVEQEFGAGWSMHVNRNGTKFTKYAFLDVAVPCSRWEYQNWSFALDGQGAQAAVRIWRDGTFASLRRGVSSGGSYYPGRPRKSTDNARGWLDINGRFTRRSRAVGTLRAWSTDGCDTGWMPYKARYLRTGWRQYIDRL